MANENKDVIRVFETATNIPTTLRNGMFGYDTTNDRLAIKLLTGGFMKYFSDDTKQMLLAGTQTVTGEKTFNEFLLRSSVQTAITASTTQTQGQGLLSKERNYVTVVANANDTVTLPTVRAGLDCVVYNSGANILKIFPNTGNYINELAINTAVTLEAGATYVFQGFSSTLWIGYKSNGELGAVTGMIDNAIVRGDGTTGIQSSNILIDDDDNITQVNSMSIGFVGDPVMNLGHASDQGLITTVGTLGLYLATAGFHVIEMNDFTDEFNIRSIGTMELTSNNNMTLTSDNGNIELYGDSILLQSNVVLNIITTGTDINISSRGNVRFDIDQNANETDKTFKWYTNNTLKLMQLDEAGDVTIDIGRLAVGSTTQRSVITGIGGSGVTAGLTLADSGVSEVTQRSYIKNLHYYTNTEEPMTLIAGRVTSSSSSIYFGGGISGENSVVTAEFYAAANNTTLTGTLNFFYTSSKFYMQQDVTMANNKKIGAENNNNLLTLIGNDTATTGTMMRLYGSTHATKAYDWDVVANGTGSHIHYDHSASVLAMKTAEASTTYGFGVDLANNRVGVGYTGSGTIPTSLYVVGGNSATAGVRVQDVETNSASKDGRIKGGHYTNSEEPVTIFIARNSSGSNTLSIGGSSSAENAITTCYLYAAATTTTVTGSNIAYWDVNKFSIEKSFLLSGTVTQSSTTGTYGSPTSISVATYSHLYYTAAGESFVTLTGGYDGQMLFITVTSVSGLLNLSNVNNFADAALAGIGGAWLRYDSTTTYWYAVKAVYDNPPPP